MPISRQYVNGQWVDILSAPATMVTTDTAQTITGLKTFSPSAAANSGLIVKGLASQTGALQRWENNLGGAVAIIGATGQFFIGRADGGARVNIQSSTAAEVTLAVQGQASQTGNLQQWQNSGGTILSRISSAGHVIVPAFGVVTDNTANYIQKGNDGFGTSLLEFRSSNGTVMSRFDNMGAFISNAIGIGTATSTANGNLQIYEGASVQGSSQLIVFGQGSVPTLTVNGNASGGATNVMSSRTASGIVLNVKGSGAATITNASLTANVATITTLADHGYTSGRTVIISGTGGTVFNGTYTIASVPTTKTFTYAKTNADVASFSTGGTSQSVTQTADLQQWQDAIGTVVAKMSPAGAFSTGLTTVTNNSGNANLSALVITATGQQNFPWIEMRNSSAVMVAQVTAGGHFQGTGLKSTDGVKEFTMTAGRINNNSDIWMQAGVVHRYYSPDGTKSKDVGVGNDGLLSLGSINLGSGTWATNSSVLSVLAPNATLRSSINAYGNVVASVTVNNNSAGWGATVPLTVNHDGGFTAPETSFTADLQQWQVGGTVRARMNNTGVLRVPSVMGSEGFKFGPGGLTGDPIGGYIAGISAYVNAPVFAIRGISGQTADLQVWMDSANSTLARISSTGQIFEGANRVYSAGNTVPVAGLSATGTRDATTYLRGDNTWASVVGGVTSVNTRTGAVTGLAEANAVVDLTTDQTITGQKTFQHSSASVVPLVLKGAAAGTANLLSVQNSAAETLMTISSTGSLTINGPASILGSVTIPTSTAYGYLQFKNSTNPATTSMIASRIYTSALSSLGTTFGVAELRALTGSTIADGAEEGYWQFYNSMAGGMVTTVRIGEGGTGTGQVYIPTMLPARKGLVVRGAASQTATLAEFQNSAGTVLTSIAADGTITSPTINDMANMIMMMSGI